MGGPHPALARTRRAVEETFDAAGVGAGSSVLLAVSGGSDSMALAQAAVFVCRREGIVASSLTVDHGWREGSASEAASVRSALEAMGVESAAVARVESKGDGGVESAARAARYAALAEAARSMPGRAAVVCGHTADDQAETVLMGLGRGSGPRSIAGMPAVGACPGAPDVPLIRPFLGLRRAELRRALASEGVEWVEDPTNDVDSPVRAADGSLLRRAAVRHRCMPALEDSLGPGVVEALARTAAMIREDLSALDGFAEEIDAKLGAEPSVRELGGLPSALRTRILRRRAIDGGARPGELTSWHIATLDSLVSRRRGGSSLDLPGMRVTIDEGRITFDGAVPTNREENRGSS